MGSKRLVLLSIGVTLLLLRFCKAQIVPGVNVALEVLGTQLSPTGTTVYGQPRSFQGTIINIGTASSITGDLTFVAGGVPICTAPLLPNNTLVGTTVDLNDLSLDLTAFALNAITAQLDTLPGGSVISNILLSLLGLPAGSTITAADLAANPAGLASVINYLTNLSTVPVVGPTLAAALSSLGLFPVKITGGVVATCTTSTIPVGTYTGLQVAYADLTVGGVTIPASQAIPLLNPTLNLGLTTFSVVKAATSTSSTSTPSGTGGSTVPINVAVTNTNFPPSTLPPDGGTVTAYLGTTPIGSATVTPTTSGATDTVTINALIPANTPVGPQGITLIYSGTPNFAGSTALAGAPGSPTINVVGITPTFTANPTPANPAPGATVTVTGTATSPNGGPTPTGNVTFVVNGNTYGPFPLDNTGAFTGTFPAPTTVGPYTVTVPYAPGPGFLAPSPPFSFPITVTNGGGGQTPTISQNVTPTQPPAGSPVTVTGTVTGPTGTPGAGTVDIKVNGTTVITVVVGPDGSFTGTFPAPSTPGAYDVTSSFTPAPGSPLNPGTSAPTTITVGPALATITETVTPNPAGPGATVTASGSVTTPTGSPGGTVTVYVNGVPVGTATVGADGKFSIPFTAPTAPGTYNVLTTYTPTGATAPTASYLVPLVVSTGTGSTTITISFGNGGNGGFAFPNCIGNLVVSVSGSGTPLPTGPVTLQLSGGKLGTNNVTIGTVSFVNGVATFNLESLKVKNEIVTKLITHLTDIKKEILNKKDILDYSLLPAGDFLLLPGEYTLTALYLGDTNYGPASGSAPFNIDPLCLLVALALKV